jgi:hypothetical protein
MSKRIFQGLYKTDILNDFVFNEVLLKMNAWSDGKDKGLYEDLEASGDLSASV